jgi:hypothetical protein
MAAWTPSTADVTIVLAPAQAPDQSPLSTPDTTLMAASVILAASGSAVVRAGIRGSTPSANACCVVSLKVDQTPFRLRDWASIAPP